VTATPKCVVPTLIGAKLASAKATITKRHCRVGKLRYVKSTNKQRGRVIKQRPAPGKQLKNGTTVDLWIGR
jgi:beta-lactam-binding protein with PASTA domain